MMNENNGTTINKNSHNHRTLLPSRNNSDLSSFMTAYDDGNNKTNNDVMIDMNHDDVRSIVTSPPQDEVSVSIATNTSSISSSNGTSNTTMIMKDSIMTNEKFRNVLLSTTNGSSPTSSVYRKDEEDNDNMNSNSSLFRQVSMATGDSTSNINHRIEIHNINSDDDRIGNNINDDEAVNDYNNNNNNDSILCSFPSWTILFVENYIQILSRCIYISLIFMIFIIWPMGHYSFIHFQQVTDSTFHPIHNSPSDIAMKAFQNAFHININNANLILNSTSTNIDWNDPMNPPLIIMLEDINNYTIMHDDNTNDTVQYYDGINQSRMYKKTERNLVLEYPYHISPADNDDDGGNYSDTSTTTTTTVVHNSYLSPITNDRNSESYKSASKFSNGLLPYLMNETYNCWELESLSQSNDNNKTMECNNHNDQWLKVTSYYSLCDNDGLSYIANKTMKSMTNGGDVALIIVQYYFPNNIPDRERKHRVKELMYAIDHYKDLFFTTSPLQNDSGESHQQRHLNNNIEEENEKGSSSSNGTVNDEQKRYFNVKYTGIKYFSSDLLLSTLHDIKRMDVIVIPLALLLIGIVIPKCSPYYIWIIPVITIITTICIWSIIMYWGIIMNQLITLQISTFTPTIMMSLSLGMGIDYTLFLLARYSEERQLLFNKNSNNNNTNNHDACKRIAIRNMLLGSGHVLILSGLTLACTFIGLVMLPLPMLRSIGIGASITILSSLCVNLLVVPTLLLTKLGDLIISSPNTNLNVISSNDHSNNESDALCIDDASEVKQLTAPLLPNSHMDAIPTNTDESGHAFARSGRTVRFHGSVLDRHDENMVGNGTGLNHMESQNRVDQENNIGHYHNRNVVSPSTLGQQRNVVVERSIWLRLAKHLLHPYKGIIILLLTCQVLYPIAEHVMDMKTSLSFDLLLPKKSPSLIAYHELEEKFGSNPNNGNTGNGRMNPYRILFDATNTNITMASEIGFRIIHFVIETLRSIDHHRVSSNKSDDYLIDDLFVSSLPLSYSDKLYDHEINYFYNRTNTGVDEDIEELTKIIFHKDTHHDNKENCDLNHCEVISNTSSPSQSSKVIVESPMQHTEYTGIAVLQNINVPYSVFASAKFCSQVEPYCPIELLHVLNEVDKMSTSYNKKATVITATLMNTNPFSDNGIEWLLHARRVLDQLRNKPYMHGVEVYIDGSAGIAYDAVHGVYSAFPKMILSTTIIVFILMGLFFRSIFPPLRSIVSIGITLSFSFGLTVMVFQENSLFNHPWKNQQNVGYSSEILNSSLDEISWLVPIMGFSIIVGLALDYDVFLISRILEYRMQNYEHRTSIAYGLHSTGSIITAAGVIMAVAFGSLMLSSNPVLYQWSFLLTTAVLLDTFIVRICVVPVLTNLAGSKYCWWPRHFPTRLDTVVRQPVFCLPEYKEKYRFGSDDVACLLRTLEETSEYEPLR